MKTIALILVLIALPTSASAAALYDGSGLYVQAVLDADIGIDVGTGSTDTSSSTQTTASTSADVNVSVGGIKAAIDVATEADLAAYGASLRTSDPDVEKAEAEVDGDVIVAYYHPARLFGIFPVRAKSETTVRTDAGGTVTSETRMPWWSMFATGTGDVATSIDAELSNSGQIMTDMKLSGNAAARARVLEAVTNAHARTAVQAAGT